ncbi:methylamine utilization protein [Marinomonas communis]|jgi:plastocyanin|uniref:Plastocyanin n=1 Tax=Marinomonas communis TaxID=28254 RepID=A0A4R6X6X0_9GAMM|nr:methylamine utilization protein [Marinomonas communis]TDR12463.1 hypothetical protein C8D85_2497 [Marinomonas communis]
MLKCSSYLAVSFALAWPCVSFAQIDFKVVDEQGQPLNEAVVFVKSPALQAKSQPLANVEMAQADRQFIPGVQVVTLNTSMTFPNQDDVRHHVYSFSPAKVFELELYTGTPDTPVVFDEVGIVELGCNIHDSMLAWVLVNDTPVFAKTNDTGAVVFNDLMPSAYTLEVWHKNFPYGAPYEAFTVTAEELKSTHTLQLKTKGVSF